MSDIVERLRKPMVQGLTHPIDAERAKAATEIDQLRAVRDSYFEQCKTMDAEMERLRALKTPASAQLLNITKGCLDDAEAENARLRDALSAAGLWRDMGEENARLKAMYKASAERHEMKSAEIARLKAALRQITEIELQGFGLDYGEIEQAQAIARAALAPNP